MTNNVTNKNTKLKRSITLKNKILKLKDDKFSSFEDKLNPYLTKNDIKWKKGLIKMFRTPFSPTGIKANTDFYTYINYNWLHNTSKEAEILEAKDKYYVQIDNFRVTQDKVYNELIDIVKNYIKHNDNKLSKEINNIYKSALNDCNKSTKSHISDIMRHYDEYTSEGNLWKYLAHINYNEVISWGCPIYWSMQNDERESHTYHNYISAPTLSLYDTMLYFDDMPGETPESKIYRKKVKSNYLNYITKIFNACLGSNHNLKASDVFECETEIILSFGCKNNLKIKENPDYYNRVNKKDALKYGFDWEQFTQYLGYKQTPEFFICPDLNYLTCVCKLLNENWKTPKWKSYWIYIYFRQIIRFDLKLDEIYYDFNGKFLKGQPARFPQNIYPVFMISFTFNSFLTNEYVKLHTNEQIIKYVEAMGKDLITVYKRIINRNTWLSPSTKKSAILKLEHLTLEIGRPKIMRKDPLLNYSSTDPYGNIMKICQWKTNRFINLDNKAIIDIPLIDWNQFKLVGTQAYIVNAFYTATENKIYIPLAYLQQPFIDLNERGIEYNLAHIGDTLAHEMSHALDDNGSKYDYKGNLNDWWTKSDKIKYKKIIKDIVKQYETFAARDGVKFDAEIGVGEDMADISGLAICEEYLRDFQMKNSDIIPIQSISFQAFFIYYAIQERQHVYKKAFEAQLKSNPHPMDKYRTNVPLSRMKLFRSLYNIKEGDGMWWHSTNTIWNTKWN